MAELSVLLAVICHRCPMLRLTSQRFLRGKRGGELIVSASVTKQTNIKSKIKCIPF